MKTDIIRDLKENIVFVVFGILLLWIWVGLRLIQDYSPSYFGISAFFTILGLYGFLLYGIKASSDKINRITLLITGGFLGLPIIMSVINPAYLQLSGYIAIGGIMAANLIISFFFEREPTE